MSDTLKKQINQVFYSCRYITLSRSLKWWEQEKIEKMRRLSRLTLREKCPNTEFSLVRIFPHSDWIRRYGISLRIQSECGKLRTRKNSVFGHSPHSVSRLTRWQEKKIKSIRRLSTCLRIVSHCVSNYEHPLKSNCHLHFIWKKHFWSCIIWRV